MSFPVAAAITAGANIGSGIIGALTAKKQQKRANQFNIDMWNRQNEYNAPKNQMARLKEAGLNPNLIYGSNAGGASGNASNAPQFEQMAESGYRPVDIPSTLASFQSFTDWDIKKATADKLVAQTENEKASTLLKIADQAQRSLQNQKLRHESPYWSDVARLSADALEAGLKKTQADTKFTLNQDERNAIQTSQSVAESVQRILQMRSGVQLNNAQIQNLKEDNTIKRLQAEMAKSGITPDTPWYAKAIERLIEGLTDGEGMFKNLLPKFDYKSLNPFK